jgi:hypothetical protein
MRRQKFPPTFGLSMKAAGLVNDEGGWSRK